MDVTNIENLDGFIYYLSKRQKISCRRFAKGDASYFLTITELPRRPCRALRQQWLYHWEDGPADSASRDPQGGVSEETGWRTVRHATLKAEPVRKTGWRCSASRDPQGGAGEKDVLETVVTRHKLH